MCLALARLQRSSHQRFWGMSCYSYKELQGRILDDTIYFFLLCTVPASTSIFCNCAGRVGDRIAKIWGFGFSLGLNVKRQEKVAGIDPHILEGFSYRLIEGIVTRGAEVCTTWERGALGAYLRNTY